MAPPEGALTADPAEIPGGLIGLMCPSGIPLVSGICRQLTDNNLNRVTATIEPAGAPRDFHMSAAFSTGEPILTIPVRIHLKNPFLGDKCYIGTTSDPVLLKPQNVTAPSLSLQRFSADGTPNDDEGEMGRYTFDGADQGDATFAVPGASGCGAGLLDWAVNLKTGLPSAAGKNSVTLDATTTYFGSPYDPVGLAPNEGRKLSEFWHSAKR
ncbi:Secreted protein OS=Streptomyces griseus subsp. griseus (strain JCM 4626 / NBRC) OX=455632 GN=SGR_1044 PE=4 SV=1 [Streptomyces griseus subsp. griseus]